MTVLGSHTLAEVKALLVAKDYEHAREQELYNGLTDAQRLQDPAWPINFTAFETNYQLASVPGRARVALFPPESLKYYPAEDEYQSIAQSVAGETDLFKRLLGMGAVVPKDWIVPQPPKDDDVDLGVYQNADDILKTVNPASNPVPYLLAGAGLALLAILVIKLK